MKTHWMLVAIIAISFAVFALFQFDAESRRRVKKLDAKVAELSLQLQTLGRSVNRSDVDADLRELKRNAEFHYEEFKQHRMKVAELLELLVEKDESLSSHLNKLSPSSKTSVVDTP